MRAACKWGGFCVYSCAGATLPYPASPALPACPLSAND